jgi:hypothetical protein
MHAHSNSNWPRRASRQKPALKWINTVLGNIKSVLVGTYRAVHPKHAPRYLVEFEYRFNRRYRLETMIPRLAYIALRTAPMPFLYVDEKSQIQALDRTQPGLPLKKGGAGTMTHDWRGRHAPYSSLQK